jgi:uncharacterized membrane protein
MDSLWTLLYIFFMIIFFMIFFMVIMDLFSDHTMGGGAKAVWIIFLILFPPITVLVYLIARGKSMGERRQAQMEAAQQAQKAYIQSAVGSVSPADQIASAKALLDAGTITQAEFDSLKTKALA